MNGDEDYLGTCFGCGVLGIHGHYCSKCKALPKEEQLPVAELPKPYFSGGECPHYYRIEVAGTVISPFDVIESLALNFNLGCVLKYVLRSGRKTIDPLDDLRKARNCIDREIRLLEAAVPKPAPVWTAKQQKRKTELERIGAIVDAWPEWQRSAFIAVSKSAPDSQPAPVVSAR